MLDALRKFYEGWHEINENWNKYEEIMHSDKVLEKYPFEKSFNELEILEWVETIEEELYEELKGYNKNI